MRALSACAILAFFCIGCSWNIKSYRALRNIEIQVCGALDEEGAERDAQSFQDQINKQFDSNIKLPRLPFHVGRYMDSLLERDGIMVVYIEGNFF